MHATNILNSGRGLARLALSTVSAIALSATGALAQESADDDDFAIEEIVVTSTKRGVQRLQDVPISIVAFSEQAIRDRRIDNFFDFALSVPGLNFEDAGPGDKNFIIRGINRSAGVATVGMYIDEVLVTGDLRQPDIKLFDVQQIEVLRGPQGTLYGSGSLSGTIRIVTKKPDSSAFLAEVDSTVSFTRFGGTNKEANVVLNVPVDEGNFAVRAVGYIRNMSGFIDNIRLGDKGVNTERTEGGRVSARFTPSENTTLTGTVFYQETDLEGRHLFVVGNGKFKTDQYVFDPFRDDYEIYSLTFEHDFGKYNLTAATSYFNRKVSDTFDSTPFNKQVLGPISEFFFNNVLGIPVTGQTNQTDTSKFWTNEVRVATDLGGKYEGVLGLFYRESDTTFNTEVEANDENGIILNPRAHVFGEFLSSDTDQFAIFGEASYKITDQITALVGLRWFTANRVDNRESTFPFGGFAPPRVEPLLRTSADKLTPKFYLSYQATADALIYAIASQGFRSGGGNQNNVIPLAPENLKFDPDSLWNFELGAKTTWLDGRLVLNGGVYYILWDNIQVGDRTSDDNAFSFTSNAGEARVLGLEIEANARPVPGLDLTATLGIVDAQLTEDQPTENFGFGGRDGDPFPNVPNITASFSAQYAWPLGNALEGVVRGDVSTVDSSRTEFNPTSPINNKKSAYTLVNVQFGLRGDTGWQANVFVDNLFDELAEINIIEAPGNLTPKSIVPNRPRTVGINLRYGF